MQFQDYYQTLGVQKGASADEIKKAYRRLSKEFHPDRNRSKGAEEKFKRVNEAYEVLKDPEKRSRYDAMGGGYRAGQDFRPPPGWQGGWQGVEFDFGSAGSGGPIGGFSDFFEAFFGGGARTRGPGAGYRAYGKPPRPEEGADVEAEVTITLEDACRGATRALDLSRKVPSADGGRRHEKRTLNVRIPPGATEGTRIRLKGQGEPSPFGGPPGDLFLKVRFAPHPRFEASGHDLSTRLPITPWEAALGAKVPLETLDGEVTLTIPPGSQSGKRMRLRGKGLPKKGGEAGHLEVVLQVAVPPSLSDEERRLFEELQERSSFNPRG